MTDSQLLEDVRVVTEITEPGDHDTFAHYVNKEKWGNALLNGDPVRALCGKVWHPTKDASRYPTCPECQAEYDKLDPND